MRLISAPMLRQCMEYRGLTVRALADRVGVAHGTIGWLTSGKRSATKPATAKAIAEALDYPVDFLFSPTVVHGTRTKKAAD